VAKEIFVPFFSTKQRGTGIGLSLSRQMLLMMGMTLRLSDSPQSGYNVTFVIENV
jgi:signal transduction histidine kinase